MLKRLQWFLASLALAVTGSAAPAGHSQRYVLVLQDPPLSKQVLAGPAHSRALLHTVAAEARRAKLIGAQAALKSVLRQRGIPVVGSVNTLANAVFVSAGPERAAELSTLPGVSAVLPVVKLHRTLNTALGLINTSAGWAALGGEASAGAGMKIAILDTGIDETHPGFIDPSLTFPPGFPVSGNADDATHTTNKIIAVRSFVSALAIGNGTPELTRPDDLSARDRVGHGTAVAMIAAGVSHQSPAGTISGVAPKAWLGNYKIFGSPGVNDFTTSDVVLQALEAAFNDGFDIALLSAGDLQATWGPTDQGATCSLAAGSYCDPFAGAVTAAVAGGMVVVLPAGNDGALGESTINTPGDVDAAVTVGATTNAHIVAATVSTAARTFEARLGDGPQPTAPISAPLVPVFTLDHTGYGCQSLPAASLSGNIALVLDGECSLASKVLNAEAAGAVAVLVSSLPTGPQLFSPTGLGNTGIPTALIAGTSGTNLQQYLAANNGAAVTLDPTPAETTPGTADQVAYFSSRGPDIRDSSIKPDLAAPGESILTAAQNLDPNGDLYSPNRYTGVDGTSFAAAFVAGAAALVIEAHPSYTPAQVKSALENTASSGITDFDANGNPIAARSIAVGGGKVNIGAAIGSTLTVAPASISFGVVSGSSPSQTFAITNTGTAAATVQFRVTPRDLDLNASVSVTPSTVNLAPGVSANVTVAVKSSAIAPGLYEGTITATGGAAPISVPYLYLAASGNPTSLIPLAGQNFVTETSSSVNLSFDTLDQSAAPVANEPLRFAPDASVYAETASTDMLGIGEAYMLAGTTLGDQSFSADLLTNASRVEFDGRVRVRPQINANGVVDGASFAAPAGFAPGSYLTILGTGLSEAATAAAGNSALPISLAGVSVSFDSPTANIHVPAPISYAGPGQVNVQIPWELAGTSSAVMKLTLSNSSSKTVRPDDSELGTYQSQLMTVPLAQYSPAFFQYSDATSGKLFAAALDEQYNLVGPANPVAPGHYVQFFLNGLGAVMAGTQPVSGAPSPGGTQLATTTVQPTVTIGGQAAPVEFSGLAPSLVGVYQVNVMVPQASPTGIQPVQLTIGGITAQSSIAVQ